MLTTTATMHKRYNVINIPSHLHASGNNESTISRISGRHSNSIQLVTMAISAVFKVFTEIFGTAKKPK